MTNPARKLAVAAALIVGAFLWGYGLGLIAPANAAPPAIGGTCGGQDWHVQAPVDCTRTRKIDGTFITVHVVMAANGFTTSTFTLATPRATDTLVHTTSHLGNSDAGGPFTDPGGIIPAGSRGPVTLTIPRARCGQLDNRAVFNNTRGRVAGPYINNTSCSPPIPTSIVTTTTPSSSVPPSTVPHGSSSTVPTTRPGVHPPVTPGTINTVPKGSSLAATGSDSSSAVGAALMLAVVGGGLIVATRRRVVR